MKVVINKCFGGYGLSDEAYEWLAKTYSIPIVKYTDEVLGNDGLYEEEPKNDNVILDRELTLEGEDEINDKLYHNFKERTLITQRYWDTGWTRNRADERIVALVETLGEKANSKFAKLAVVEIPDGIKYVIEEYDGNEHIAEAHQTWN